MNLHKAEFIRSAAHSKDFIHDGRPQITLAGAQMWESPQ